jgi:RNA polymerase sigma factor (sigma-70 family)
MEKITLWLEQFKQGDQIAAQKIWETCVEELTAYARKQFGNQPRRVADEEDIVQSAFASFCRGIDAKRFHGLDDRSDLWQLLLMLTHQKFVDHTRRALRRKRGGGQVRGDSIFQQSMDSGRGFNQITDDTLDPQFAVELSEGIELMLSSLGNSTLRSVAMMRLEGYSNEEIAQHLNLSTRSIERKLKQIRAQWESYSSKVE